MADPRVAALDHFWALVNTRELDRAVELYAPDATVSLAGRIATGRAEIQRELAEFISSFPDIVYSPGDRIIGDGQIVEEWSARGTHGSLFMGRPATSAAVSIHAVTIYEFHGTEVWRDRTYLDMAPLLLRTGVLAPVATQMEGA